MRKQLILIFILTAFLTSVLEAGCALFGSRIYTSPRERMQLELAKELGVRIEDYPYRKSFPSGYFYTILQPGIPIAEVHNIVRGYEKVLHCGQRSEIYYYFSSELKDAKRFKLLYDGQGKYLDFEGEEDDSRTIHTYGCEPGQITP